MAKRVAKKAAKKAVKTVAKRATKRAAKTVKKAVKKAAKKSAKTAAKKTVKRARKAGQRDLVQAPNATFYATREDDGSFKEMDEIGRSLSADRRRTAKRTVKAGFGDQGDQPKRAAKKSAKKR